MENGKAPEQQEPQKDIMFDPGIIERIERSLHLMREQRADLDRRILQQEGALNILVMIRDGKIPPVPPSDARSPAGIPAVPRGKQQLSARKDTK